MTLEWLFLELQRLAHLSIIALVDIGRTLPHWQLVAHVPALHTAQRGMVA